ncbi:MAG TPA: site-specific DNA-methyltransferase, partial [Arthrobacter sp.]
RYVDAKDGYRHSKWLSFMEKRLLIAKALLKPTGVLVMAIDDNEHHRLRMLADDVFGENNFISNLVWQGGHKNDSKYISAGHDYMLVYAKSEEELTLRGARWRERKPGIDVALAEASRIWSSASGDHSEATKKWRSWMKTFKDSGVATDAVTRYTSLDEKTGIPIFTGGNLSWPGGGGPRYDVLHPVTGKPVKVPSSGWRFKPDRMQELIEEGRVRFGPDHSSGAQGVQYLNEMDQQVPKSFFVHDRRAAATKLGGVFGEKRFPFPKDVDVLMRWIGIMTPKDAVVLDFFGGSGTTAEAVVRLNAEEGGSRQAILVTNNELSKVDDTNLRKAGHAPGDDEYEALGVFHHVTKPRLETVVTGVRQDGSTYSDGLNANVAFFELTYLDEPDIVRGAAFNDLAGLFWLKAGGFGGTVELTAGAKADGFAISESGRTAVLFTPGRAQALAEKLAATEHTISHLFIVTDSEAQGDEAATHFPGGITVERIYGSYLEAFQVNRKD